MKQYFSFFIFLFFLSIAGQCTGQKTSPFSDSFTENTSDQEKFGVYIDSISKYIYRDAQIAEIGLTECQNLLDQRIEISDQHRFDFAAYKILYLHNMDQPLEAYRVLHDCEGYLDSLDIPKSDLEYFYYLKSFTFMNIGDLESAQRTYYANLERASINKDTASMMQSLFSLGQFYNNQHEYEEAVRTLRESQKNSDHTTHPQTLVLISMELGEAYEGLKDMEQALDILESTYTMADTNNLEILKYECLIKKGNLFIADQQLGKAVRVNEELKSVSGDFKDQQLITYAKIFQADLFRANQQHTQALNIFTDLTAKTDSTQHDLLMRFYTNMHEINKDLQQHAAAYDHLLSYTKIKKQKDEDARKQKTNYLKIKFDTEKKERENVLMAAEIVQNEAKSKQLYIWLALSLMVISLVVVALFQKSKYSKMLETEVKKRTLNLKESNDLLNKSNQELKKFNHLLSHDLKEPIRSIVSFSQLANRAKASKEQIKEYLEYVIKSGQQLQNLVTSINTFQQTHNIDFCTRDVLQLDSVLNNTMKALEAKYPEKQIVLSGDTFVSLVSVKVALTSILKILLDNSIKFNEHQVVQIDFDYSKKDRQHHFIIRDNGIGIDKVYHQKIFGMLTRLHDRQTYLGSGMGLSIAQKLVEKMGGTIEVKTTDHQSGSSFLLKLPIIDAASLSDSRTAQLTKPTVIG